MNKFFFKDKAGFSTAGMVVALLLTCTLIIASTQVYQIKSQGGSLQSVADACAVAAMNDVAEFVSFVRVNDAIILSLSCTSAITYGLSAAALCTTFTASLSPELASVAQEIIEIRNTYATTVAEAIQARQELLPITATLRAYEVASAQNNITGKQYSCVSILVPLVGATVQVGDDLNADTVENALDKYGDDIEQKASEAEGSAEKAYAVLKEAYQHDCGYNPDYCLYERAAKLANLSGTSNPYYKSASSWTFNVALKRSQAYYEARYKAESESVVEMMEGGAPADEVTKAIARCTFYYYAATEVAKGYVKETSSSFEAYFPDIPTDTESMKQTSLYTSTLFPVTSLCDDTLLIHSYSNCPGAASDVLFYTTLEDAETGGGRYTICPACGFDSDTLGYVASMTSRAENGFEYHYLKIKELAEEYAPLKNQASKDSSQAKSVADKLLKVIASFFSGMGSVRISIDPPGSSGALVLAFDETEDVLSFAGSTLSSGSQTQNYTRVALSAATLVESDEECANLISMADPTAFSELESSLSALGAVFDIWQITLDVYAKGYSVIESAITSFFKALGFVSGSAGLGSWAQKEFKKLMKASGFQPAKTQLVKPLLVNTSNVVNGDSSDADSTSLYSLFVEAGLVGSVLWSSVSDEVWQ